MTYFLDDDDKNTSSELTLNAAISFGEKKMHNFQMSPEAMKKALDESHPEVPKLPESLKMDADKLMDAVMYGVKRSLALYKYEHTCQKCGSSGKFSVKYLCISDYLELTCLRCGHLFPTERRNETHVEP